MDNKLMARLRSGIIDELTKRAANKLCGTLPDRTRPLANALVQMAQYSGYNKALADDESGNTDELDKLSANIEKATEELNKMMVDEP